MSTFGTSPFDVRTAYLIIALLDIALPTFVWIALSGQRRAAVQLWCGGGLVVGMAFMAMGLRGHAPEWVTYACGNLLLLVGVQMHAQSLRLDLGHGWRTRGMVVVALAYIATYELLRLEVNDGPLRLQLVYVLYTVLDGLLLHIAVLAWRIARVEGSRNARWIARSYGLLLGALVLRQLAVFTGIGGAKALASGVDMQLLALALVVNAVIGHVGYVGLALDRSTRREIKSVAALARDEVSRRLGTQIATLDRQRSLGTMAASLAHELSQPLNAVLTNAQVAQRGLQLGRFDATHIAELLDKILRNTQRAGQIIDRIRGFIRPAESKSEPVNLVHVVHELAELVADEAKSRSVSLTLEPLERTVLVSADPVQLSQVVLNIVRNAMEALSGATRRDVHLAIRRRQERAILQIRDTGPGLTPEVLLRVGSPFFTTKADGLGLGLSIARTLTEQFGGVLSLQNVDGGGALVELDFPVLPAPGEEGRDP